MVENHPVSPRCAAPAAAWAGSDGAREDFCGAALFFALAWMRVPGSEMPEGRSAPRPEPLKGW